MALNRDAGVDNVAWPRQPTHPPAGHRVGFGETAAADRPARDRLTQATNTDMGGVAVNQLFVNFV